MEEYQKRVVEEKEQNDDRLNKLDAFIHGESFDGIHDPQRTLLVQQAEVMRRLSLILKQRIELF